MKIKFNLSVNASDYSEISSISNYGELPQMINSFKGSSVIGVYYIVNITNDITYYIDTDLYKYNNNIMNNSIKEATRVLRNQKLDTLLNNQQIKINENKI